MTFVENTGVTEACHGPHMYEEWFIGPRNANPAEIPSWTRPYTAASALGTQRAAPLNAWLMAPPVVFTTPNAADVMQTGNQARCSFSGRIVHSRRSIGIHDVV